MRKEQHCRELATIKSLIAVSYWIISRLNSVYMDALKHFAETEEEKVPISIVFKGKIFVLTGFDSRDENQITEIITSRGWHC